MDPLGGDQVPQTRQGPGYLNRERVREMSQRRYVSRATNVADDAYSGEGARGYGHMPKHPSSNRGVGYQRRGRPTDSTVMRKQLPANYFTREDIEELSTSDDETIARRITQNENGFLKAFKHDRFCKNPKVLEQMVKILYKLAKSSDTTTALRVLAQIFGPSGEHALFLFHLEQLTKEAETKLFIREENLQALYQLTEIGKFCIEKIPKTVQRTFPILSIQAATESLKKHSTSSDIQLVTLEDMEQNVLELKIQFMNVEEEQVKPKPKPTRQEGDEEQEPPEHFTTLSTLPLSQEVHYHAKKPYLRANITKGKYQNWDHYIDVQFRLLREDFVRPLREGITELHENPSLKGSDVRVYRNVTIRQPVCLAMGIGFELSFDVRSLRRVNWEYTKRLINGSLLCLSTDNFETIAFASVAQRETKQLEEGIVTVKFEGSVNGFQLNPEAVYTMVETVAYFEAYRHVLEKLQAVSEEHEIDMMPFKQYIVDCTFEDIPLPKYLSHRGHTVFDLQGVIEIKSKYVSSKVDLTNVTSWPAADITDLDNSQMTALKAALTQEVSVIQGPPGTGKTYVGMKIIKAFLANREVWDPLKTTPILVVCYTNHALDQFLEGIRQDEIQGKPPNVTRIGGRCKSEILAECTLQNKVSKAMADRSVPTQEYRQYTEARHDMGYQKYKIIEYLEGIHLSRNKILRIDKLRDFILRRHYEQLTPTAYSNTSIELWLGLKYADPNEEDSIASERRPLQGNLQPEKYDPNNEETPEATKDSIDQNTEVRMIQDDRLVEGNEVVYKPPEEYEVEPREDVKKKSYGGWHIVKIEHRKVGKKNDGGWQTVQMPEHKKQQLIRKQLSKGLKPMSNDEAQSVPDLWLLDKSQRWRLYLHWRESYVNYLRQQLEQISQSYVRACEECQLKRQGIDLSIIHGSDVVGMTTTGAAKHNHIIQSIKPKIVVVEEAAEIFEPHVFTSLCPTVQQLILIGDHQQLRPKPTCYELETKYNFNVSLFERLALNGCPVQTLNIQHRMRPAIASLITPAVYNELYNHESVEKYGHVKGVGKSLFFINHTEPEIAGIDDQRSHSNPHEAKFLGGLCDYLVKQGYKSSEITILTLYRGQLIEIKKTLEQRHITRVRTAVVDDFQGEENEIILLSLVRSNREQRIGFVGIENRVCVALSRAKMGLYITGNLHMLRDKVTTIWPKVIEQLSSMDCIGESLPLHCQIHKDQKVDVKTAEDFLKCPEGGCLKKCDTRLLCGHVCRRLCHPYDIEHLEYKCMQNCGKQLSCGHVCKHKCYECSNGCLPCKENVIRVLPLCGHTKRCVCSDETWKDKCASQCEKTLQCGHRCQENCSEPCTVQCSELVDKHLPCGHTVQDACYLREERVKCSAQCGYLLDCEHQCTGICGTCKISHHHMQCASRCGRTLLCGHVCDFPCTPSCPPCSKPCANFCTHSHCPKKCYEPCSPCMEPCDWSCPHYTCSQPCGMPCDRPPCDRPCPIHLKCGHQCIGLCGELCPKFCRVCDKDIVTEVFFGNEDEEDAKFILLPDCNHIVEVRGLDHWMTTSSNSSESEEVTLNVCPKCKTPVRKCLRYGNDIKSKLEDVEAIKKKQMSTIQGQSVDLSSELARVMKEVCAKNLKPTTSYSIAEEVYAIETAIKNSQDYIIFPHILKAKLTILSQLVMVHEILSSIQQSRGFTIFNYYFTTATNYIKQRMNYLKDFIMQEFLSQQQISDAEAEMRRLTLLAKMIELHTKLALKRHEVAHADLDSIKQTMIELKKSGWTIEKVSLEYESKVLKIIESLRNKYGIDRLSETETLQIVKAVVLLKGHWFKCLKGHYYCIGECGGAVEKARCPDCRAEIRNPYHALALGNQHAPGMDSS